MAHAVERMMYAGLTPWHGLGKAVPANLPWQQAIVEAGLDWNVFLHPVYVLGADGPREIEDVVAVVRGTDHSPLGVVGSKYAPVQNRDAFEVFNAFFGDSAVLNTAGSLHGGRVVWGLAEVPDGGFTVGNDKHVAYLLVTNSHDGRSSLRAYPTVVRVVCANTLAASRGGEKDGISVRHTGDPTSRLREKTTVLKKALGWFRDYAESCHKLLDTILTHEESRGLVSQLVNAESTRGKNVIDSILRLSETGTGNAPYKGTAYALWEGVTDYVDHYRMPGQYGDTRFSNASFGSGAAMKAQALELLLDAAGGKAAAPATGLLDTILNAQ